MVAAMALHHHERWDGKGYPKGLKGEAIPMGSRIIALCDAVDAMTSHRPYRRALSWPQCREEIAANKTRQFDAVLVEAAEVLWPNRVKRYAHIKRLLMFINPGSIVCPFVKGES